MDPITNPTPPATPPQQPDGAHHDTDGAKATVPMPEPPTAIPTPKPEDHAAPEANHDMPNPEHGAPAGDHDMAKPLVTPPAPDKPVDMPATTPMAAPVMGGHDTPHTDDKPLGTPMTPPAMHEEKSEDKPLGGMLGGLLDKKEEHDAPEPKMGDVVAHSPVMPPAPTLGASASSATPAPMGGGHVSDIMPKPAMPSAPMGEHDDKKDEHAMPEPVMGGHDAPTPTPVAPPPVTPPAPVTPPPSAPSLGSSVPPVTPGTPTPAAVSAVTGSLGGLPPLASAGQPAAVPGPGMPTAPTAPGAVPGSDKHEAKSGSHTGAIVVLILAILGFIVGGMLLMASFCVGPQLPFLSERFNCTTSTLTQPGSVPITLPSASTATSATPVVSPTTSL